MFSAAVLAVLTPKSVFSALARTALVLTVVIIGAWVTLAMAVKPELAADGIAFFLFFGTPLALIVWAMRRS